MPSVTLETLPNPHYGSACSSGYWKILTTSEGFYEDWTKEKTHTFPRALPRTHEVLDLVLSSPPRVKIKHPCLICAHLNETGVVRKPLSLAKCVRTDCHLKPLNSSSKLRLFQRGSTTLPVPMWLNNSASSSVAQQVYWISLGGKTLKVVGCLFLFCFTLIIYTSFQQNTTDGLSSFTRHWPSPGMPWYIGTRCLPKPLQIVEGKSSVTS